ncbi:LamB/YcsF family protein [Psychromonas sp. L1A2]
MYKQAIRLVKYEHVISTDRSKINIKADTLCIHGNN